MSLAQHIRRNTPAYDALMSYVEERLNSYRRQLESTDVPLEKVPALRARIAELKSLHQSITEEDRNEQ